MLACAHWQSSQYSFKFCCVRSRAVVYWTCMVFEVRNPAVYRALLAVALGAGVWLALRESQQSPGSLAAWFARHKIFLLGAAGEQEENGLGASASGPARTLTQNVPLGSRVVSQKVNFLGQGNKGRLISSAVRRRTGEYPPARLLLPGGLAACGALSPKYKYSVGGSPTQKYFPFWATPTICTHLPLRSPSQKRLPTGSWFGQ